MNERKPWKFTCKTCDGHKLTVYRIWEILAGPESETWQDWGPLEADHTWRFKYKEKIEKEDEEDYDDDDGNLWNFREYTKDNSSSKPVEYEIFELEDNPATTSFI